MTANLLTLPYDVRYLIYQQLFPPDEQFYIQAYGTKLQHMQADGLPIHTLLVSRQIHAEASGYLYNSYLFNIVGTKEDCLANYETMLSSLRKYARSSVRIDAFSNGIHSATMCISLQAGEAKTGILDRRARGQRMTIQALKQEVDARKCKPGYGGNIPAYLPICGVFLALVAWLLWQT